MMRRTFPLVMIGLLLLVGGIVAAQTAPDLTQTYTTPDETFTLRLPEGWNAVDTAYPLRPIVITDGAGDEAVVLNLVLSSLWRTPEIGRPENPAELAARIFGEGMADLTFEALTVNGAPAAIADAATDNVDGVALAVLRDDSYYALITATGATGTQADLRTLALAILDTLTVTPPPELAPEPAADAETITLADERTTLQYPSGWIVGAETPGQTLITSQPGLSPSDTLTAGDFIVVMVPAPIADTVAATIGAFPYAILRAFQQQAGAQTPQIIRQADLNGHPTAYTEINTPAAAALDLVTLLDGGHLLLVRAFAASDDGEALRDHVFTLIASAETAPPEPVAYAIDGVDLPQTVEYAPLGVAVDYPADWVILRESQSALTLTNNPDAEVGVIVPGQMVVLVSTGRPPYPDLLPDAFTPLDVLWQTAPFSVLDLGAPYPVLLGDTLAARADFRPQAGAPDGTQILTVPLDEGFVTLTAYAAEGELGDFEAVLHAMAASARLLPVAP